MKIIILLLIVFGSHSPFPYQVSQLREVPADILKHIPDVINVRLTKWAWPLSEWPQVHFHYRQSLGCQSASECVCVCVWAMWVILTFGIVRKVYWYRVRSCHGNRGEPLVNYFSQQHNTNIPGTLKKNKKKLFSSSSEAYSCCRLAISASLSIAGKRVGSMSLSRSAWSNT